MTEPQPLTSRSRTNPPDHESNITARLFSTFILILEIIWLHIKFYYSVFESIYLLIFPPEKADVKDEIVLITGTAHGMGKELAIQYASKGAKVVCWDINEKGNLETVAEIKARGGKAYHYVCNVLSRDDIIDVAEKVKTEVGTVTILVNNAGIMPCHPLHEHTKTEIENIFGINVLAHFWLLQTFLPGMIAKEHGHIVALSSCAGLFGIKNLVPYCASKFAVRGLMHALGEDLRADPKSAKIKLTTIYPYMVDTGLCKKPYSRFPNLLKLVKPNEAAAAIIAAQRRGLAEVSIPRIYLYLEGISRVTPKSSVKLLNDFLATGVNSDK